MEHFDFEQVKKYLDNDTVVLKGFLGLLKKELPASYQELNRAFEKNDVAQLRESAHRLKGTALSASLPNVTTIASRLNKFQTLEKEPVQSLLNDLQHEITIIMPLLESALASMEK